MDYKKYNKNHFNLNKTSSKRAYCKCSHSCCLSHQISALSVFGQPDTRSQCCSRQSITVELWLSLKLLKDMITGYSSKRMHWAAHLLSPCLNFGHVDLCHNTHKAGFLLLVDIWLLSVFWLWIYVLLLGLLPHSFHNVALFTTVFWS